MRLPVLIVRRMTMRFMCFRDKRIYQFIFLFIFVYFLVIFMKPFQRPAEPQYHKNWEFDTPDVCGKSSEYREGIATKTVILWTTFFGLEHDNGAYDYGPYVDIDDRSCSKRCYFTSNRSLAERASALMFHKVDLKFDDLPLFRIDQQKWIFYLYESPLNAGYLTEDEWIKANGIEFNWIMSYHKKAHILAPYGLLRRSKKPVDADSVQAKITSFANSFKTRKADAVWLVSNCKAESRRWEYFEVLRSLGLNIEIYGKCGNPFPEAEFISLGEKGFYSQYRFVISFENSVCEDYISEKGFHGIYLNYLTGAIPLFYGGGDYSEQFPVGSYIDVRSYEYIDELVDKIKNLSQSDSSNPDLMSYYKWQTEFVPEYEEGFEIQPGTDNYYPSYVKRPVWRRICKAVWDNEGNDEPANYVTDIREHLGTCDRYPPMPKLSSKFNTKL